MIGLAYALKGEIRSMLHTADAKPLETVSGVAIYEIEPGLLAYCEEQGWPAAFYSAEALRELDGDFTHSERVLRVTGVDNVCERAAMMGAHRLVVRKTALHGVTVALAEERWEARFPG